MWTYEQSTGILRKDGASVGTGYAGRNTPLELGKNNPSAQSISTVGPLPQGLYTIGEAYHDPHLGPLAMRLTPDPHNLMFGRSGFFIHADSIEHPGEASEGCIVLKLELRQMIAGSSDRRLQVVE